MEFIECPRQRGGVLISTYACGFRYLQIQGIKCKVFGHGFGIVRRGLEICRICPGGRLNAEGLSVKDRPARVRPVMAGDIERYNPELM